MSDFNIRRADLRNERDVGLILHADAICFARAIKADELTGAWWLAFCGDDLAGYAGIKPSTQWQATGYLCRAGVVPEYRGFGLQKRLIRVRLAHAKASGWAWVVSDTHNSPQSSNSLIACGFRMYSPTKPWWKSRTAVYWRKRL